MNSLELIEENARAHLRVFQDREDSEYVVLEWEGAYGDRPQAKLLLVDYQEYQDGKRTSYNIVVKSETGHWPPTEEEERQSRLAFLRDDLQLVHDITLPNNPNLFDELPELEPIYQAWLVEQERETSGEN